MSKLIQAIAGILCLATSLPALAQRDPGVRGGMQNTSGELERRGIPIPHPPVISPNPTSGATININELASFEEGVRRAGQLESTCDGCADVPDGTPVVGLGELDPDFPQFHTNSNGLGARHSGDQCFVCHTQPTLGGAGGLLVPNPGQGTPLPPENPMFRLVPRRFGKQNITPSFEKQFGPIRLVRFKRKPDGTPDGRARALWTVRGITKDPTLHDCELTQPDFEEELENGNLAFRIPLQLLGLGLIESVQDREILRLHDASASRRAMLGIAGHPNIATDGTTSRFGWKAQDKSITLLAGEAYNSAMGITNELFPQNLDEDPACNGNNKPEPNDVLRTDPDDHNNQSFHNPLHILPDWMQFQVMMRFTDAPQPDPNPSASAKKGAVVFADIGCDLCHTPQMQTAPTMNSPVLQDRPINLYSDLLLHHMGSNLADDIVQGAAGPDEFRTVPLWGVGKRLFFLHDGRTSDLLDAIKEHQSPATAKHPASEANEVIENFLHLSKDDKQAILDFLRSL